MKLIPILAIAALALPVSAQTVSKAQVFSGKDIAAQFAALVQKAQAAGSSGATLLDQPSHAIKLSVRTKSGGAEIHAHYDDLFVVTQGRATLITGGAVANAHLVSEGETQGSRVQGGISRIIAKGDIVNIPAGTPHQITVAPGDTYSAIVIKVKE